MQNINVFSLCVLCRCLLHRPAVQLPRGAALQRYSVRWTEPVWPHQPLTPQPILLLEQFPQPMTASLAFWTSASCCSSLCWKSDWTLLWGPAPLQTQSDYMWQNTEGLRVFRVQGARYCGKCRRICIVLLDRCASFLFKLSIMSPTVL